jgi:hypothetical protein
MYTFARHGVPIVSGVPEDEFDDRYMVSFTEAVTKMKMKKILPHHAAVQGTALVVYPPPIFDIAHTERVFVPARPK